jgi:hypothetical protein
MLKLIIEYETNTNLLALYLKNLLLQIPQVVSINNWGHGISQTAKIPAHLRTDVGISYCRPYYLVISAITSSVVNT